ncbi:MAG: hypothetical protein WHW07_10260 [Bacteroidales bacterium]|jgi:hypothetical protein|nr:hypothetical protein [Bacteroidales bacterium]HOL97477.1 hypothetical protein [Bacteroidales bacterium]HOM37480.1 hypothetical protein [Bacteroidales bacterium]HPD23037.1 hypothetical protein [Bacteroidales bacterium]HRS98876.1 hypothetical protein [Bacteroidales bacterium]
MTKQIENIKLTKEQKQLLEELFSKDEEVVLNALNRIEEVGNVVFIKPLLELYFSSLTVKAKKAVEKIFSNIKVKNVAEEVESVVAEYKHHKEIKNIIVALWESSINFNDLRPFCEIFVVADEQTALEIFTLIEQNIANQSPHNNKECLNIISSDKKHYSDFKTRLYNELEKIFNDYLPSSL